MKVVIVTTFPLQPGTAPASRIRLLTLACMDQGARVHVIGSPPIAREELGPDAVGTYFSGIPVTYVNGFTALPGARHIARFGTRVAARMRLAARAWEATREPDSIVLIYSSPIDVGLPCFLAAKLRRRPVFFEINELVPRQEFAGDGRLAAFMSHDLGHRWLPRVSDGVIAITSHIGEKFAGSRVPVLILPSLFDPVADYGGEPVEFPVAQAQPFRVMYVGQGKREDGLLELLAAILLLRETDLNVELEIVGNVGGSIEEHFVAMGCGNDPLPDWLHLSGWVSPEEYPARLESADCLVLPRPRCGTNQANFPTRLPEFLRTGKPVVIGDSGDVRLYLVHRQDALLLHESSAEEIADAIRGLAADPSLAKSIGQAGKHRGAAAFSYRAHALPLHQFLEANSRIRK